MTDPRTASDSTAYTRRLEAAVEARRPLDAPDLLPEAGDPDGQAFWESQRRLDQAIEAWQAQHRSRRRPRGRVAGGAALAALAAGLLAFAGRTAMVEPVNRPSAVAVVSVVTVGSPRPVAPAEPPQPPAADSVAVAFTGGPDRFAEAAEQADRLAYAFQPVKDGVSDVMRLLIDAVPGAQGLML